MFKVTKDSAFTNQLTDNLRKRYDKNKRYMDEPVHVSDLLDSSCLRKQYYYRKYPRKNLITDDQLFSFVRGEASEFVITKLANIGAAQVRIELDGIIARPDILRHGKELSVDDFLVVELKDSASVGRRLDFNDFKFKSYLQQLLYYLVITGIERGVLCITYSTYETEWIKRDDLGDHYLKSYDAKPPGLEAWSVFMSLDDPLREELKDELMKRRDRFLEALQENRVDVLPRLVGIYKKLKCKRCCFLDQCFIKDDETVDAIKFGLKSSVINRAFS